MKTQQALRTLNPLLAVLVPHQAVTGLFADSLPDGLFVPLHTAGGVVLLLAALLHVFLNWNWIKANYFKRRPAPAGKGRR